MAIKQINKKTELSLVHKTVKLLHRYVVIFAAIFVLAVSSVSFVHGQNSVENSDLFLKSLENKMQRLDDLMPAQITVTLTGLSLTGSSFLVGVIKNLGQEANATRINIARRSFIKAFFMFLLCSFTVFVFDFLQILYDTNVVTVSLFDIIISYSLFGIGIYYLVMAAKALYVTYGKTN